MTPKKRKYDLSAEPEGLNTKEFDVYRLGILTTMLACIEDGAIEAPPGIFMQQMTNEHKFRKARVRENNYNNQPGHPRS